MMSCSLCSYADWLSVHQPFIWTTSLHSCSRHWVHEELCSKIKYPPLTMEVKDICFYMDDKITGSYRNFIDRDSIYVLRYIVHWKKSPLVDNKVKHRSLVTRLHPPWVCLDQGRWEFVLKYWKPKTEKKHVICDKKQSALCSRDSSGKILTFRHGASVLQ